MLNCVGWIFGKQVWLQALSHYHHLVYDAYFWGLYDEGIATALSNSFPIHIIPATSDVIGITATS